MTSPQFLLLTSLSLPLAGAVIVWLSAQNSQSKARCLALVTVLATLVPAGTLVFQYSPESASEFAVVDHSWLGVQSDLDVRFSVGLDGLSVWLYGLSALLMVTCVLVSWEAIKQRPAAFYALLLLLETGMLGVFVARDIILFYIFFEFTLIPLFLLIGVWGSEERRFAAMKFFLYTFAGSVLTFLGLLSIVLWRYWQEPAARLSFSIPDLQAFYASSAMDTTWQCWIFAALFVGFAIKVPLFPLHTWLPLAHVQAPTAGSVLLAGVLLKIGTYGFARFNLPMLPDATAQFAPWLLWLSAIGIVYGALVALAQSDIKRLIAYSSVSHLGFCMLGIFALNGPGVQGGILQAVNHGISTGALFALVGMIYERYHTRQIRELGGLARRLPVLAFFMLLFTFSSIGLPGLNGFAGEFVLLTGMFQRAWQTDAPQLAMQLKVITLLALAGVVLGAWYMLYLVQRVFFGQLREPHSESGFTEELHEVKDLSIREVLALAPLVVFVVWIGIQPSYFVDRMRPTLNEASAAAQQRWEQQALTVSEDVAAGEALSEE
jgi:NADH-quinone oxidoreductase subunit M